jgi:hypothetical protein
VNATTTRRKYRWHHVPMTREEATVFIAMHKAGQPLLALELQEAVRVLSRTRDTQMRLPQLSPAERARVNGVLLYRLGLELGRLNERRTA